ncbi:MAG: hypothetical protein KDE27_30420, partial [Planctomycetes bacterium]|nr:hypothetical protein [Planctomycetota bacterium]
MRPLALVAAAAVAGLGAGCVTVPGAVADGGRDELRVETSDLAAAPTTALADFLAFARVGFESGGTRALDRLVQLFPELALEAALRADTATDAIGPSYDRVHGDGDPAARAALGAVLAGGDPGRGPFPPHAALRLAL